MSNLLDLVKEKYSSVEGLTESKIKKRTGKSVDPTQAAREKVLEKLNENIEGLKALNEGKEWPVHPAKEYDKENPPKRIPQPRPYAQWFNLNEEDGTYEIFIKYGLKKIPGIFGVDKDGKDIEVMAEISKDTLLPIFIEIRDLVEAGKVDELLLAARKASAIKRNT